MSTETKSKYTDEEIKNSIMQLIELIEKTNVPNFICFGTKENIDKVKFYLPENVESRVVPDSYLPNDSQDKIYIIPNENGRTVKYII